MGSQAASSPWCHEVLESPKGIHLGAEPDLDTRADRRSTAYLFVGDADGLAGTWLAAGGDVRLPQDTEWGQHEGVLIDPDGNVVRFGSPMRAD